MESVYENLKNHFRRKLSCFRLELLGFDLLKGVAVVLFTFLLFLFFYAGLLSFFRLLPDFKYVLLRGVYRIVHKKLERKCERKACKYKEFERFEGDLGKKNEMYTGLICFNLV